MITADGKWMKNNINEYTIKKIYKTVTIFYLGGVSNLQVKIIENENQYWIDFIIQRIS